MTCDAAALAKKLRGLPYSCEGRIEYLMKKYSDSETEACSTAVRGGACGPECDPGYCSKLSSSESEPSSSLEYLGKSPDVHTRRLAVASFIDGTEHMFGTYSIRVQMEKFNMTAQGVVQVAVVPTTFRATHKKEWGVLHQWLDKKNIYEVDKDHIYNKLTSGGVWKPTFNKLWLFNLTNYDKVIVLDLDILIRTSLMHWFDYPTPCATQAQDNIEWNSGAMVIMPSTDVFNQMLAILPKMASFSDEKFAEKPKMNDNWNSAYHDQGFLSAFYTHQDRGNATSKDRMKTMPTEASILSSSIVRKQFIYFTEFRRHIFETVHFTTDKPWKGRTGPSNLALCLMLQEWAGSVKGIDQYMNPCKNDFLRNCPKQT